MAEGVYGGGMHDRGCAWWGACMIGNMCGGGHAWQGGGHVWQERWPPQWMVRILLECVLVSHCPQTKKWEGNVFTGVCLFTGEGVLIPTGVDTWDMGFYGIWLASRRYASYWNVLLSPANEVVGRECFYTCLSVHGEGEVSYPPKEHTSPGTTRAGVTHPTGMLSC